MLHKPVTAGDRLFLIDGSGFIFRAYHALPPLTRASDGLPLGAVSGFCNMLFKLTEDMKASEQPTHIAVIFDASSKTFRNDMYPEYKANRPPPPEDLIPQFPLCRDATRAFGIDAVEMLGYEADDLIATYAKQAAAKGAEVRIYSSDKDLMQLISHNIKLVDPLKNKFMGEAEAFEKFGVDPIRIPYVQALAGDSVDNVPGVAGIGLKTAALLIQEFGDLENLLNNAHKIPQQKRRENLIADTEKARLSYRLVILKDDVDVQKSIDDFGFREPNLNEVTEFLTAMELKTLNKRVHARLSPQEHKIVEKLPVTPQKNFQNDLFSDFTVPTIQKTVTPVILNKKYELITTPEQFEKLLKKIDDTGHFVFDTETTGLNIMTAELVGIAISCGLGHGVYIPVAHDTGEQLSRDFVLNALKPYFESMQFLKIAHNLKYDAGILKNYNIDIVCFDDTMLMSFALYGGKHQHNMDSLSHFYLNHTPISFEDVVGKGKNQKTFNQIPLDSALNYAAEDADITCQLWHLFKNELIRQKQHSLYQSIERKMPLIVLDMERTGFLIDRDILKKLSGEFECESLEIKTKIFHIAGTEFNIASPKQIGDILFDVLKITPTGKQKTTATGQLATGADILDDLAAEGHEIAELILKWRGLQKLKSTYCDALQNHIDSKTGRVHSSFHLTGAATGRFSSSDPNLQNIPIKTPEGRKIREAFGSDAGKSIIAADYSQIELRILAHIANIPLLKQAFLNNEDIHTRTASEVFNIPITQVTSDIRRKAKAVNFGIIYGISAFGLARQLKISNHEAKSYIDSYFARLPEVKTYMQTTKEFAHEHGYVMTPFGRKIWVKDISSTNHSLRSFSERAAINAPIQGAAADSIKYAMIDMDILLKTEFTDCKMLSQVHDELIFEVPDEKITLFTERLKSIMQHAPLKQCALSVPLVVDIGIGKNWGQAH